MVKNLGPIRDLKKLTELDAHFATVVDLRVLKGMTKLEILNVSKNASLFSLKGVEYLPNLKELNCSDTRINDLTPVSKLKRLQILDFSKTPVETLRPIQLVKSIYEIDCSDTKISGKSLDYLLGHSNMTMIRAKNIDIENNEIAALEKIFIRRNPNATVIITSKK